MPYHHIQDKAFTAQDRADLEEFLLDYEWRHSPDYGHEPQQQGPDYYKLVWWAATILVNLAAWFFAWWAFSNFFMH